jgi:hypothetical protein
VEHIYFGKRAIASPARKGYDGITLATRKPDGTISIDRLSVGSGDAKFEEHHSRGHLAFSDLERCF